ncbi:hypothetical protein L0F63_007428, partial [Massospora cicadina]
LDTGYMRVLCVAEKPSQAKKIAEKLSDATVISVRPSFNFGRALPRHHGDALAIIWVVLQIAFHRAVTLPWL